MPKIIKNPRINGRIKLKYLQLTNIIDKNMQIFFWHFFALALIHMKVPMLVNDVTKKT